MLSLIVVLLFPSLTTSFLPPSFRPPLHSPPASAGIQNPLLRSGAALRLERSQPHSRLYAPRLLNANPDGRSPEDWFSGLKNLLDASVSQFNERLGEQAQSAPNFDDDDEETVTAEEVMKRKDALRSERRAEKSELASFRKRLDSLRAEEISSEVAARTRLPDPDDLRAVMSASSKGFDQCMAALRSALSVEPDREVAVVRAVASLTSLDYAALSFVQRKASATLEESVEALRSAGGEDGDDTLAACVRVREMRVERLSKNLGETRAEETKTVGEVKENPEDKVKEEWEAFRDDMMAFLEEESKKPPEQQALIPAPDMLRKVMAETGAGFKASMSALRDALEAGLDDSSAVATASDRVASSMPRAGEVSEAQLRLSRLDERISSFNEGDDVAARVQGEYWQAKIVKVMERRSGTMFRVRFSDGSEQVVDTDSVKQALSDDEGS